MEGLRRSRLLHGGSLVTALCAALGLVACGGGGGGTAGGNGTQTQVSVLGTKHSVPLPDMLPGTSNGGATAQRQGRTGTGSSAPGATPAPSVGMPTSTQRLHGHRRPHRPISPDQVHMTPAKPQHGQLSSSGPQALPQLPGPSGGDPYTAARRICGNRNTVDLVPQQYRDDPQFLAQMCAQVFDPAHHDAAEAGCLAGLHDLGY